MADNVASSLILWIAALALAGLAAGVMASVVVEFSGELQDRGKGLAEAVGTDLSIANDPQNVPYSAGSLTLYVKNIGSTTLKTEELLVLVNGEHQTFTSSLLDGATSWTPGTVVQLTVSVTLSTGDHRARVIHTPSISDSIDFRV